MSRCWTEGPWLAAPPGPVGNILVSDKLPGPELDLARLSIRLWQRIAAEVGGFEYEAKGGVVVAASEAGLAELLETSREQSAAGVATVRIPANALVEYEPHLAPDLVGGAFYPEDAQVQPMLAAAHLLVAARSRGAQVRLGVEATGFLRDGDRVVGVLTDEGRVPAGAVINAAGTWGGGLAALAGLELPVLPRRGFILVTEPLPGWCGTRSTRRSTSPTWPAVMPLCTSPLWWKAPGPDPC